MSDSLAISHDLDQRTLYIGVQKLDPEMFRCLPLSFTSRFLMALNETSLRVLQDVGARWLKAKRDRSRTRIQLMRMVDGGKTGLLHRTLAGLTE